MNRKQWHYVSLVVRDAQVEVGYVKSVGGTTLHLTRPQANWPAQISNRVAHSADAFPDREFSITLEGKAVGFKNNQQTDAASLLKPGQPVMVLPPATMRVEWIPTPAERWDPNKDPLKGNYDEYPKRQNPRIDEEFYQHGTTGYLIDSKLTERDVDNWGDGKTKKVGSWLIDVPYGPKQGKYIVPTRGHKTKQIIAGHFNNFPSIPAMRNGRRVTVWAYRTQRAPNFLLFDAQEMEVEETISEIHSNTLTLKVPSKDGEKEVQITVDDTASYYSLGKSINKTKALAKGNVIRIYAARPLSVVAGNK